MVVVVVALVESRPLIISLSPAKNGKLLNRTGKRNAERPNNPAFLRSACGATSPVEVSTAEDAQTTAGYISWIKRVYAKYTTRKPTSLARTL